MSISFGARQNLRLALRNIEKADEILDALEQALTQSSNYEQTFSIGAWVVEGTDTYSLDINHNLGTLSPIVKLYETGVVTKEVVPHLIKIINSNSIRLSVSQIGADARFSGKIIIDR